MNEPATVVWTTNVMHKYKELADSGTPQDAYFTVELYEGYYQDESDLSSMTALQMWNASDTPELVNAMSFTIPKGVLSKVSTSQTPSYTVRISTSHPSQPSITLSALAYIVVNSQPIVVTLDKSMGSYIKDKDFEYIDLKWDIQNYDKVNGADFEFKITKNGQLVKYISGFDGSSSTESGGSYRLNIDKVSETNRLKDSYVITLAAKNQLDTGWSYDSLYLQVYRSEAFRIQVDGVPKDSHTMSNVDAIRNMSHEDRLKLKRKINLQNDMTINYGDYTDVSMFSDQFIWKSSNNEVGAIYYASSGRIADIETFGYSSYQPTSRFILAGIEDGQTTITATHANTGMTVDLNVTVETLRDKLYWFQFYPKVKTTITYTDKKGVEKTVESNEHGELALFENNGIGSDVYATSYVSDNQDPEKVITYTGVISREALLSKEKDPSTLELYPINILQLRKLSEVEVYFKKPDGKPYTGKVTYRAGVYKNGEYAPAAEIGGSGITEQLGSDGRLMITFDTTKFYTEKEQNAANLSAKDKIEIVVEVFFEGDNYFPQLLYFDGDTSPTDAIIFGDKISELIENPKKQKTPFMVNQFVTVEQNEKLSILTYTGKFGPNNYYPSIILTTEFMWWGEQVDEEKAFAELLTDTEAKPQGQSYQTLRYPFSDIIITRHEQVINSETIWLGKAESGTIHYRLYKDPGDFRQSFVAKAKLINMLGVEDVDVNELKNWLEDLRKKMEQSNTNLSSDGQFDPMVTDAMELLNKLSFSFGPLTMKLFPTDDPSVFQSIVYLNVSNLPKVANNPQGGGSSQVENLEVSKYSVTPGLMDIYRTYKGTFKQNAKEEALKDLYGGESHRNTLYSVGGYYLGEIRYNKSTDKWEHYVVGGGFNVGGGVEFVKNYNTFLGPIPVTFSMSVGGAVQVDFKASILYDEIEGLEWSQSYKGSSAVNDYLTSLRVLAYLELFGGVGLDFTIAAAKVGTFGRITIEDITRWLNRDYLENASERVKTGNMLTLEGIVGVRAVIKFLFLSVKYDFASYRYSHSWVFLKWKEIEDYWQKHFRQPLTAENVNMAIALYQAANVIDDLQMQETMTVEDRSYLLNGGRTWNTAGTSKDRFSLMKIDEENGAPLKLQTNAYPYAYPQLADDGSLFVYLSDGNSDKIEDTVASWAIRDLNGYVDMGAIDQNKGYGDSNLKVAGEGDLIAAVWVRQKEKIDKDPGDEIKNEDIVLMANSTEIMAGIYQNKVWTSYSLTNNDTPDLGPVVAVGGGKVFVAYRSTGPANAKNPLDFTTSDAIVYTIYNTETGKWSDVQYLYNGTNGTVMGLSATALEDGTVAVVYTVNNEEVPDKGNITSDYLSGKGNEIVYAVIDKNGNVIKNLQVTYDDLVNENPQITTAMFPDNKERFVIAWHTTNMVDGELVQDIKLLAVNADGEVYVDFIDSLNILQTHHNLKINSNFAFARMKRDWRSIENLSILWKETETEYRNGTIVTRDAVRTVKFGVDMHEDNSFALYLSGVIDVATMPDYTVVDSIDALCE